ncbi:MAG: SNF2 helicase associated domain-containing protein [Pirellulales bacterium]|nr:SNF2 helicase associated domain-containing protein [Pirellulales bacterium]
MSFAKSCAWEFDREEQSRGKSHFDRGRVALERSADHSACAVVADKSVGFETFVDWSDARAGFIEVRCACSTFDEEGVCEHIWATMLAADAKGIGPQSGPRKLYIVEADSPDSEPEDEDFDDPDDEDFWERSSLHGHGGLRSPFAGPGARQSRGASGWQNRLSAVFQGNQSSSPGDVIQSLEKPREAWYVLDVTSSLPRDRLAIKLLQREARQTGEFGKLKHLKLRKSEIRRFPLTEDREMLRLLLANAEADDGFLGGDNRSRYGYYGRYEPATSGVALSAEAYEQVLPKLSATGRFVWMLDSTGQDPERDRRTVTWDGGPPWRLRLTVEADDQKKRWRFVGQLVREAEAGPVSLKTPVLLLSGGLVLMDDRLARLDAGDDFGWIAALRDGPAIEVPYKDRGELMSRLWQLPKRPEMVLPANLRWEEVRVAPQGRLTVRSSKKKYGPQGVCGDVEFRYGGKTIRPRDASAGTFDAETGQVLVRDPMKERELLVFLAQRGAQPADRRADREHDVWIRTQQFAGLVDALVAAGWEVEAEGRLFRKPGQCRMSVTSGIDWFDLDGTFDFDGVSATLPDLLAAIRRGEKYVRLGDGSHGLLPQEWLTRFGPLADLGSSEDGCIRFRPSQALLLDALLAAQEQVSVDGRFDEVRKKLRSFSGVMPKAEPRGFCGELRAYQKEGHGWLHFLREFHLGGCLADDMGLGKTVQVLALLQARRMRPKDGGGRRAPSLAVVPRSLVFNWLEEAQRFTPNLRVLDYTGPQREGLLDRLDDYDLLVTTYGTMHRDITKLKDVCFDYAILDEAQAIKNAQSQRAKACRLLQADHRLAMTGTPVENHLGELWSLFEFLNPGMLGSSAAFQKISKTTSVGSEDLAILRRALAPFILRRTKGQVLAELPEKSEQTLYCDLEGKQRKHYNELRDYYRKMLSERIQNMGMAKAKIHVLEALLRLRQAACHPGLLDKKRLDDPSVKLDTLLEQLREVIDEGHKVLVFSQFTSFLSIVRRRLDAEGIVYEYLDGQTRNRQERVHRFQNDPACPLFLISLKAGGHGLNLTAADYVFILDPWWNPAVEAQAVDRTHRIGQTRHVFAYRLIARDTVEEKVVELQKTKRDLAEAIVSADSNVLRNLTAEDLEMLLS